VDIKVPSGPQNSMREEPTREPTRKALAVMVKCSDARTQVVHPQVDGAQLGKTLQALGGGFVHVLGRQRSHDGRAADGVQHGADDTPMDAVVGKVPHQLRPHVDAGLHTFGRDLDHFQAQGFVEDDFFFVDFAKAFNVFGLKDHGCGGAMGHQAILPLAGQLQTVKNL
jgi:hypothetical protein